MMIRTITSAMLLIFSTAALADDMKTDQLTHGERVQKDFLALDKDSNGLLSNEELNADPKLAGSFVEIDLNDNNSIDMDEFVIYRSEATAAGRASDEKMDDEEY